MGRLLLVTFMVTLLAVLAACGGGSEPTATPGPPTASSPASGSTPVIEIGADANLLAFQPKAVQVQAGQQVTVRFVNPSTVFQHNWLLIDGGEEAAKAIDELAIQAGPEANYIPDDPRVLAAIPLVDTGQTGEVTFTAPSTPGEYFYICTFPGHYLAGMVGVMTVQ